MINNYISITKFIAYQRQIEKEFVYFFVHDLSQPP